MSDVVQVLVTLPGHPSSLQALVSLVDIILHRKQKLEQLQSHYKTGMSSDALGGHDASGICIDVTPLLSAYQATLWESMNSLL